MKFFYDSNVLSCLIVFFSTIPTPNKGMKAIFAIVFCCIVLPGYCRQIYTVQDGDWESPSTWYQQMPPNSVNDTVRILHHVSLHSNIILNTNDVLIIDTSGTLCGNDSLYMYDNSELINYGFLGLYYWEQDGPGCYSVNITEADIDIGEEGASFNGGTFFDSLGCVIVHAGLQKCNYSCSVDTPVFVQVDQDIATFILDSSGVSYEYYFGDGYSTTNNATWYQSHQYADTGLYDVIILIYVCCNPDTVYTTVHITYQPPPPVPPCDDSFSFVMGPNPADEQFIISRRFCTDREVTVKLFAITGQLVYSNRFSTVSEGMNATVSTNMLSPSCYVLDVEAGDVVYRKRIVVVHPD